MISQLSSKKKVENHFFGKPQSFNFIPFLINYHPKALENSGLGDTEKSKVMP
jgi:hypothetical protein